MQDDCLKLCAQIRACLVEERQALIALDVEALAKSTLKKENLKQALAREVSSQETQAHFASLSTDLVSHDEFLRHSLKNLLKLHLQLKQLLGETPLYSSK